MTKWLLLVVLTLASGCKARDRPRIFPGAECTTGKYSHASICTLGDRVWVCTDRCREILTFQGECRSCDQAIDPIMERP